MKKLACGWYLSLGFSFVFFEGCMSAQNHGALQEIENAMQSAQKSQGMERGPSALDANSTSAPIVEAQIEYLGPPDGWAGPQSLSIHLVARDGFARILKKWGDDPKPEAKPVMVGDPLEKPGEKISEKPSDLKDAVRTPASNVQAGAVALATMHSYPVSKLSALEARDQFDQLAHAMEDPEQNPKYTGCLSPIRVRLIRSSGVVHEKMGCRAQVGWPKKVSELTAVWISASL